MYEGVNALAGKYSEVPPVQGTEDKNKAEVMSFCSSVPGQVAFPNAFQRVTLVTRPFNSLLPRLRLTAFFGFFVRRDPVQRRGVGMVNKQDAV